MNVLARGFSLVAVVCLGVLAGAGVGRAQVRTVAPPVQPPRKLLVVPAAAGDLVITDVYLRDVFVPAAATTAVVSITNEGTADIVFPAGSVLVQGDAAQAGGIAFQPLTTPTAFTVAAGASTGLTLTVGDPCAAGAPGSVTFRVDPGNVVREADETNNTKVVAASSFGGGDLAMIGVSLKSQATVIGKDQGEVPAGYPANENVTFRNAGSAPVLLCPGVVLWRETQSPLVSKYGLREVKQGAPNKVFPPGAVWISVITGAYGIGDLPPGAYTFAVTMNPDGRIREASSANNSRADTVKIQ